MNRVHGLGVSPVCSGSAATLLAALMVGVALPACAQAPTPSADSNVVGDIVVTASRREERLHEVPLAVSAITSNTFVKSNFSNPTDLQYLSPSVQASRSGGVGFNIRGIGTASFNAATEQTVGLVIDGVVQGFVDNVTGDLSDVERIEVLRGPQGTQFGKNASAGVVNITTIKPSFDKFATVGHLAYGTYNDTNANLRENIPLGPTVAASIGASYQNRDGWSYNPVRGAKAGASNQYGVKGKLYWKPNSDFNAYFTADYHRTAISPNYLESYQVVGFGNGTIGPGFGLPASITPGYTNTQSDIRDDSYRITHTGGGSLEMNYSVGDYTLTSVSAFRQQTIAQLSNLGGTTVTYAIGDRSSGDRGLFGKQYSQELRLASPSNGVVTFVAGLYYYKRSTQENVLISGGFGRNDGKIYSSSGGEDMGTYKIESEAGFVDGTVNLSSQLKVILGGRLTHDHGEATIQTVPVAGVTPLLGAVNKPGAAEVSKTNFSYRAGLKYDFTPDVMGYATASRGYKGPLALPVAGSGARIVQPETVQSFDERRVTLNLAVFNEKFTNFQTSVLDNTLTPPAFVLGNAGGLRSQGVEVELTYHPVKPLTLTGGLTYQDAKFTDFRTSCINARLPIKLPTSTDPNATKSCVTAPGLPSFVQAAGDPIPNASKWNVTGGANYVQPINDRMQWDLNANYLYRSDFYTNGVDPNTRIHGYGIVNVNLGVGSQDGAWRVGVFARNLFNTYYISAIEPGFADAGAVLNVLNPDAKRTIGIVLDGKF